MNSCAVAGEFDMVLFVITPGNHSQATPLKTTKAHWFVEPRTLTLLAPSLHTLNKSISCTGLAYFRLTLTILLSSMPMTSTSFTSNNQPQNVVFVAWMVKKKRPWQDRSEVAPLRARKHFVFGPIREALNATSNSSVVDEGPAQPHQGIQYWTP